MLDEMKIVTGDRGMKARSVIRFLEQKTQVVSEFVHVQRPNECLKGNSEKEDAIFGCARFYERAVVVSNMTYDLCDGMAVLTTDAFDQNFKRGRI